MKLCGAITCKATVAFGEVSHYGVPLLIGTRSERSRLIYGNIDPALLTLGTFREGVIEFSHGLGCFRFRVVNRQRGEIMLLGPTGR